MVQDPGIRVQVGVGCVSVNLKFNEDIFGGRVHGVPLADGNFHCYNVVRGRTFDLTSEQFADQVLDYADNPEQSRKAHFSQDEKRLRYELLKVRLDAALGL